MKFTSSSSIYICILILSILSVSISILAAPTSDIPGPTSDELPEAIEKSSTGTNYEPLLLISEKWGDHTKKTVGPILRGEANGVVFGVWGGWFERDREVEAKRFSVKAVENFDALEEIDALNDAGRLVDYGVSFTPKGKGPGRKWAIYDKKPDQNPEGSPASEAKPETASDEPGKR